jgi:predicted O-methyltransferase YrrM
MNREWTDPPSLVTDQQLTAWNEGKTYRCDWTTNRTPVLSNVLAHLRESPARVLEIGAWEGRSSVFFLSYLPRSRIVCIDTFGGNVEHSRDDYFASLVPDIEARFDANLAGFGERVEKFKGPSCAVLPELALAGRRFDIAYIDGSHYARDVFSDAALTWPIMARDGLVIFDDYEWELMDDECERPKLGVDAFLAAFEGQYRLVHRAYQLVVAKL